MKVLLINGSPHKNGTTAAALAAVARALNERGIGTELFSLAGTTMEDCRGCGACVTLGKCVIDDEVNRFALLAKAADGFVFGSPTYYAHPSGRLLSFMDRLFYSAGKALRHKPAAAVTVARRGGNTSGFDVINKYFTINEMPVVSSTYWNMVYGANAEDAALDEEGLATMENLGKNMAHLLAALECAPAPEESVRKRTNFIR